jgi:hypothetical protein
MTIATAHLEPGQWVVASLPVGEDFGLPLVEPTTRQLRKRAHRKVRSVVRSGNGLVVRFEDGTKTRPLHGRTGWLPALGDS